MKSGAPLNPFSARFHQPGAIPFRFREGESAETIWQRFLVGGRSGQIDGPHGTGKTTLLRELERVGRADGEEIRVVTLHDGERWPRELLSWTILPGPRASNSLGKRHRRTLFLDGAEQLAPMAWLALRAWARLTRTGLLVTTHRPLGLPRLRETSVDRETACWVVDHMLSRNPDAPRLVPAASVGEALASSGGNLREALFLLYDRYEECFTSKAF